MNFCNSLLTMPLPKLQAIAVDPLEYYLCANHYQA
jgi:hypothetical protein